MSAALVLASLASERVAEGTREIGNEGVVIVLYVLIGLGSLIALTAWLFKVVQTIKRFL